MGMVSGMGGKMGRRMGGHGEFNFVQNNSQGHHTVTDSHGCFSLGRFHTEILHPAPLPPPT
jgi:hypothetical protein